MKQKTYSIYEEKTGSMLGSHNGKMMLIEHPKGMYRDNIGEWSLSKCEDIIKKRKRLKWRNYWKVEENGNQIRMALRIIRVNSSEWIELIGKQYIVARYIYK